VGTVRPFVFFQAQKMKVFTFASSVLLLCGPSSATTRINAPTTVGNVSDAGSAAYDVEAANVGIPLPIPEFVYPIIPDEVLEQFFPIDFCREEGRTMKPAVSTTDMNDAWFEEHTAGVGYALEQYQPEVVVIIGGSSGIGRANACYWAAKGKTVLSLGQRPVHLIGENQPTNIICDSAQRIINIQYDIAQPKKQRKLASILEEHGITKIDYLLLAAGRFLVGNMRDWTFDDLQHAYNTNVFGIHEVWRQLRTYLNPDFAVVFGISSQMAENQFFALSNVYAHSKKSIYDMMIGKKQLVFGSSPRPWTIAKLPAIRGSLRASLFYLEYSQLTLSLVSYFQRTLKKKSVSNQIRIMQRSSKALVVPV
jgi:NADP-dependent 3-hydroxy acid dehydrogenase YdfG